MRLGTSTAQLGILFSFLGVWELIAFSGAVSPVLAPRFSQVMLSTANLFLAGSVTKHLLLTISELVGSFAIAAVTGVAVGVLIASRAFLTNIIEPIILVLFTVPIAVIYPLMAVWFGLGMESKILFGALYGFFPIVTNTIAGVRSTDISLIRFSLSMGASKNQVFRKVILPSTAPTIIAGLRSGVNLAFIGVIFGEMFASLGGLGFLINSYSEILESEKAFGLITVGLSMTLLMNFLFRKLEGHHSRWRR